MRKGFGVITVFAALLVALGWTLPATQAASSFATPAFKAQWEAGEAIVTNFWGPLATAKDGQQEPYEGGAGRAAARAVFRQGADGATDRCRRRHERPPGDRTRHRAASRPATTHSSRWPLPPSRSRAIQTTSGPTYAQLGSTAASLLAPVPAKIGTFITVILGADGTVTDGGGFAGISMSPAISTYDSPTQHNVLGVFVDFRTKVGLASIGYAKSEPFRATVKIAGVQQSIIAQVFERRVLTYNNSNPEPFKVEFGNIGQHYYKWRYPTGLPLTVPTTPTVPPAATLPPNVLGNTTNVPIRPGMPPVSGGSCHILYPVKGFTQSGAKLYDIPGSTTYAATKPEICYINPADAEADGYHKR